MTLLIVVNWLYLQDFIINKLLDVEIAHGHLVRLGILGIGSTEVEGGKGKGDRDTIVPPVPPPQPLPALSG